MKKIILTTLCFAALVFNSLAQDAAVVAKKDTNYWKKASQFALNYNSGSFSNNWAGGGVNSVAFGVIFNTKGDYEKEKTTWTNDFQFQYGTLWNKAQGDWRKSIDRLFFDSKYGYKIAPKWNIFANLNFLSQIATGYKFDKADVKLANGQTIQADTKQQVSDLFTPAYITEAAGVEYKPNKFFSLQLAPLAIRQTIVGSSNVDKVAIPLNYGAYKDENGQRTYTNFKNNFGLIQVIANYDKDIMKDVNLKWRYQFFVPYTDLSTSVNRLDAQLTAKVAKYFNVNLGLIGLYDQTQSFQLQVANTMGVGFLYKW